MKYISGESSPQANFFYSIYVLLTALSERDFLDILSNLRGTFDQKSEGDFCTAVPCGLKSGGDASPATPPLDKPMTLHKMWCVVVISAPFLRMLRVFYQSILLINSVRVVYFPNTVYIHDIGYFRTRCILPHRVRTDRLVFLYFLLGLHSTQ